jgi:hypothetical protein
MIIANLLGGLGNQMFQYACARALTLDFGLPLKFRTDILQKYNFHNELEIKRVFGLKIDLASDKELRSSIGWARSTPAIRQVLCKQSFQWLAGQRFLGESKFSDWHKVRERSRQGAYLHGYWQSERYFVDHLDSLRADFKFRENLQGANLRIAIAIRERPAISVHIRRGDYVSNPKAHAVHGTCSPEYYFKAIEIMLQRCPKARLFGFSDDPSWVSQALLPRYPEMVLVDHNNGVNSYIDMQLMSMCCHHIIANSSFSWWGAWLNARPGRMVIAPAFWFADGRDTEDLIPDTWDKI